MNSTACLLAGCRNRLNRLLLHSCCVPYSGEVMEALYASGINYSIFFYNPNIHPLREYELRKEENIAFAEQHGIEFIDADTIQTTGLNA